MIDDDLDDNYFHQLIISEMGIANHIDTVGNGIEALNYLKNENSIPPDLIFLDINMPKMNGWEFLEQYKNLSTLQKAKVVILILSTSANPDDIKRSKEIEEVTGFESKPLSRELMTTILHKHFQDYI